MDYPLTPEPPESDRGNADAAGEVSDRTRSGEPSESMPRPEPGGRVRLRPLSNDDDGLVARVVEVEGERLLVRLSRNSEPGAPLFVAGGRIEVILGRRDSAYSFDASVLCRYEGDILAIQLSGAPRRLQRREYFRLAVRLPIAVCLDPPRRDPRAGLGTETPARDSLSDRVARDDGDSQEAHLRESLSTWEEDAPGDAESWPAASGAEILDPEPAPRAQAPQIVIFRLADLSGGGCLCLDPDERLRDGRVYRATLDLHDGLPLQVEVEAVRRGVSFGIRCVGLRFVALAESRRERIMRALFREQRRRISAGRV